MQTRRVSDQQIGALIHHIAHLYLEVERGMRPPQHLEKLLTPAEYSRHRQSPAQDRLPTTGPVVPDDIGRVRFDRDRRGNITAAVPTRETEGRWGSLVIHLMKTGKGWAVEYIQRIPRRGLTYDAQAPDPEPSDLDARIRQIDSERRLVESAFTAVKRRLGEVNDQEHPDAEVVETLRQQVEQWSRILGGIGQDLDSLKRRRRLSAVPTVSPEADSSEEQIAGVVDRKLADVLGPKPREERHRQRWDAIRTEIISYRQRWNITNTGTLLGPETAHADQQRERERVAQSLLQAARTIRGGTRRPAEAERDSGAQIELGRDLGIAR